MNNTEMRKLINLVESATHSSVLNEGTIGDFAEQLVKKLNKEIGLTYDHPRFGEIPADTFETSAQSGTGSRNQKSRGMLVRWGAANAAYQTGQDAGSIRKQARKLIDDFLATGEKIDVKSKLFGDPEGAYRFGKIVVLDEGEYLEVVTTSKLKNTNNYQSTKEDQELDLGKGSSDAHAQAAEEMMAYAREKGLAPMYRFAQDLGKLGQAQSQDEFYRIAMPMNKRYKEMNRQVQDDIIQFLKKHDLA